MTDKYRATNHPLRWLASDIEMEPEYPSHFVSLVPILRAADALIEAVWNWADEREDEYSCEQRLLKAHSVYKRAVEAWREKR